MHNDIENNIAKDSEGSVGFHSEGGPFEKPSLARARPNTQYMYQKEGLGYDHGSNSKVTASNSCFFFLIYLVRGEACA